MSLFQLKHLEVPDLDTYYQRRSDPVGVLIHRLGIGTTAKDAVQAFTGGPGYNVPDAAKVTGGKFPYTFFVDKTGMVTQCLPLSKVGPHARGYNASHVGIACAGDFRNQLPSDAQWRACAALVSILVLVEDIEDIKGHTDYPDATADPSKECPGILWSMDAFRRTVWSIMVLDADHTWWRSNHRP